MKVIVTSDYSTMSKEAADFVAAVVAAKPDAAVVFPTGNTPVGLYKELTERRHKGFFDPSALRIFQLDEYWGLQADDPRSFYTWIRQAFLVPLGIPEDNLTPLPGSGADAEAICKAYDAAIAAAGGLDLAVLGLGPNGHLGYNDPPAAADAPTRLVTLAESSLDNAASYFNGRDQVPRQAVTMGMAQLLAARQILLIVSGKQKQEILRRVLRGEVTPEVPASYLQQVHNVTVIADRDAAALLDLEKQT